MTINNKSERNYRGKCLGWPVILIATALLIKELKPTLNDNRVSSALFLLVFIFKYANCSQLLSLLLFTGYLS